MGRDDTFNRAAGDVPPEGSFDGWGTGAKGRPRLHSRHWLAGTTFADGSQPEPCWCQRPEAIAEQKRRDEAERALAAQRQRPYHPAVEPEPETVRDTDAIPPAPPSRFAFLRRRPTP